MVFTISKSVKIEKIDDSEIFHDPYSDFNDAKTYLFACRFFSCLIMSVFYLSTYGITSRFLEKHSNVSIFYSQNIISVDKSSDATSSKTLLDINLIACSVSGVFVLCLWIAILKNIVVSAKTSYEESKAMLEKSKNYFGRCIEE